MSYQLYPSDLTDREWTCLASMIPAAKIGGRRRTTDMRLVINAILYLTRSGIAWRYLPREYPRWQTVYGYFRQWRADGVWLAMHERLRTDIRRAAGRQTQPSAAIMDSQSVKTTRCGGRDRGYDAGKNVNGRKRHLLVDTLGLVLLAVVHSAHVQDRDGATLLLQGLAHRFTRLRLIWADAAYRGRLLDWVRALRSRRRLRLVIVARDPATRGFAVLPRRWVVERTFAWLSFHRRLSKDYEVRTDNSQAFIYIAMIRLMLKRLT